MDGRSAKDNFKRRFGDRAWIEIRYTEDKMLPSEDSNQGEQISKAYAGVLKGILGREPIWDKLSAKKILRGI